MEIHMRLKNTMIMITHDVDEAVLLSDRIVMMTNGPSATIGEVLEVALERPRKRLDLVNDKTYAKARAAVLDSSTRATRRRRWRRERDAQAPAHIGGGMAGVRFAEALTRRAPDRFAVTMVGAEATPGYNRVLLSALLARRDRSRHRAEVAGVVRRARREARHRRPGRRAGRRRPDRDAALGRGHRLRRLRVRDGLGRHPAAHSGADLPGVVTFRDLDDVATMEEAAGRKLNVAVIGGGLLGIEAAYGLAKRGAAVTLVHVMDRLMERQLDAPAAALLKRRIEARASGCCSGARRRAVTGGAAADGLAFADGSRLAADLVGCSPSASGRTPRWPGTPASP